MMDRDIGTYEAVAKNEHGEARQRVRLQIAEYPKFLKRPEEMYVTLRKNCKLEARVIGVPYPEIKWFKDWKPMVDSTRIQVSKSRLSFFALFSNDQNFVPILPYRLNK